MIQLKDTKIRLSNNTAKSDYTLLIEMILEEKKFIC